MVNLVPNDSDHARNKEKIYNAWKQMVRREKRRRYTRWWTWTVVGILVVLVLALYLI